MNRKLVLALLPLMLIMLLTGCGYDKVEADDPLSEDEIISYVEDKIYDETGDKVTARIVSKEPLKIATVWIDGPAAYQSVEGGNEYTLEITSKKNKDIVATGVYKDGYVIYDKDRHPSGSRQEALFYSDYSDKRSFDAVQREFVHALDKSLDDYYFFTDDSADREFVIFICSSDFEKVEGILSDLKNTAISYKEESYVNYCVFIYEDEEAFKSTDLDSFPKKHETYYGQAYAQFVLGYCTGGTVEAISNCRGFDKDYFESGGVVNSFKTFENTCSFDHVVFWFKAEPNSYSGSNSPFTYAFGVK